MYIFISVCVVLLATSASIADSLKFISTGISKNSSDYYMADYRATREIANYDCRHVYRGDLLTILTKAQDEAIQKFVQENSGVLVLTSGTKHSETGEWYWSTNLEPIGYSNWITGHPFRGYDCLAVGGGQVNYGWYSVKCENPIGFACKVD